MLSRLSSPSVIGVGEDSNMVGSDASAVWCSTKIVYLDDYEMVIIERKKHDKNFKNKKLVLTKEDIIPGWYRHQQKMTMPTIAQRNLRPLKLFKILCLAYQT